MAKDTVVEEKGTPTNEALLVEMVRKQQEQIDILMARMGEVSPIEALITALANGGAKKNGRGGKHAAQPVLDTKTGKVYRTKSAAGIAVAPEYGLKVHNFVWYELVKGTKTKPAKCPDRFQDISQEEFDAGGVTS